MKPMRRNQHWLPDVFNDVLYNDWMLKSNTTAPALNIIETGNEYKVEVATPGLSKEDFNIKIDDDNNLVVSMEKKQENKEEDKDKRYLRQDFSYMKFQQTLVLPKNVEKEKIQAKAENGVLNITIPKIDENSAVKAEKTIEIQ